MAATTGNDKLNAARYGQTATWDGLEGTDTLFFDSRANRGIKITLDDSGFIHVDSTTSASSYHFTLKNVEKVTYSGTAVDAAGQALAKTDGYYDLTSLFPPIDNTADPTVITFGPLDASTGVALDTDIVLTFSEAIQKGTGLIEIRSGSAAGTLIESFNVATSTNLTVSGLTLTINPTANLADYTQYFVTFETGSVKDLAGNSSAGTTTYDFTTGQNIVTGTAKAEKLTGTSGNDSMFGLAGNDTLDGGVGTDTMDGGTGKDSYVVDDAGDVVIETSIIAAEADTVQSSIDYILGSNLENLTLTGTVNINATGNELKNTITGNDGNNILDGADGVDKLVGGLGNDTYIVDLTIAAKLQDTITESSKTDIDTLQLRGTFTNSTAVTLTLVKTLENLDSSVTGLSILNLTGNASNNTITGNDAANVLNGVAGTDTLFGGIGDDKLIGGLGSDNLAGGAGADVFVFDAKLSSATVLNVDVITDFESGDHIQLSKSIFAKLKGIADLSNYIQGLGDQVTTNDYIIYDSSTGALSYDADGSEAGLAIQFALVGVTTHPNLVATDLFVA